MHTKSDHAASERGSIPLVLLVVIVLGAVTSVLVATVITGHESTRFDAAFTDAVQYADAGVQDAVVALNNTAALPANDTINLDGTDVIVDSTQINAQNWEVTSTATMPDGTARRVVAEVREVPLFGFALFARNGVGFNGANSADSYSSDTGVWCTGNGIVGTDGAFNFFGLKNSPCHPTNKITVDQAVLYNCADDDAAACRNTTVEGEIRCTHNGGENCLTSDENLSGVPEPDNDGRLVARPDSWKLTPEEELQRVMDENAVCEAAGWPDATPAGVGTSANGDWVLDDGDVLTPRAASTGRDYYCVKSVLFKGDTSVTRGAGDEPVRMHVRDTITVEGSGTTVNCDGCKSNQAYNETPDSGALQIIGAQTQQVMMSDPQIMWSAAVYTPTATCEGPAGVDIYGSLICQLVDNVGNWNFHYDDVLNGIGGSGRYAVASYREEIVP